MPRTKKQALLKYEEIFDEEVETDATEWLIEDGDKNLYKRAFVYEVLCIMQIWLDKRIKKTKPRAYYSLDCTLN